MNDEGRFIDAGTVTGVDEPPGNDAADGRRQTMVAHLGEELSLGLPGLDKSLLGCFSAGPGRLVASLGMVIGLAADDLLVMKAAVTLVIEGRRLLLNPSLAQESRRCRLGGLDLGKTAPEQAVIELSQDLTGLDGITEISRYGKNSPSRQFGDDGRRLLRLQGGDERDPLEKGA